jgi:transposase
MIGMEHVASSDPAAPACRSGPRIEVRLAGAELRIAPGTDAASLTMVLRAIRASAA